MLQFYKILVCFGIVGIPALFYHPGESRCISHNNVSSGYSSPPKALCT
ncbi:unnamed protein product, partial [Allacma fusca]